MAGFAGPRTLAEIWNECAEFVEPVMDVVYEGVLSEGKVVSVEGVAAALDKLYANRPHRQRVAAACYQLATRSEYEWKNIAMQWHNLFQEVLAN